MGRIASYCLPVLFVCCNILSAFAQSADSLTVKVTDIADQTPISGALVRLYDAEGDLFQEKTTDAAGIAWFSFNAATDVRSGESVGARLGSARPNPFADRTSIPFAVDRSAYVTGALYDVLGNRVASTEGLLGAGEHAFDLDLAALPAGAYFFRVARNGVELGTTTLYHLDGGNGGKVGITLLRGAGTGLPEKAVPGLWSVTVTAAGYQPFEWENLTIEGDVLVEAELTKIPDEIEVPEFGDGTPTLTTIADGSDGLFVPRDLDFNPERPWELWTVNRAFDGTVTFFYPGTDSMASLKLTDPYGNHFMEEVSAIAFSESDTFATSQESRNTYDNQAPANNFMGPALWMADTSVYAKLYGGPGWGDLGSHLDMLHESPLTMGIAHEKGNAYWVFDGYYGNVVRYDFNQDHGPGHDDHTDGIVRRYSEATVTRVPDVPGHLVLDKETNWLYVADPGGGRIIRLDILSGLRVADGNMDGSQMEYLNEYSRMGGATVEIFATQNLERPSGIALGDGRLFVTDHATGAIIAFDLEGNELGRIETGADEIMGITIGPDGRLWYVDAGSNTVMRVDP